MANLMQNLFMICAALHLRRITNNSEISTKNKLGKNKLLKVFYNLIHVVFGLKCLNSEVKKPVSTTVNGKNNNSDIGCAFSDHYNDLFNWVNYNIEDLDNLYEKVCNDSLYCLGHKHITLSDIDNAIKKNGKGDGYDGLTSEYLINGT